MQNNYIKVEDESQQAKAKAKAEAAKRRLREVRAFLAFKVPYGDKAMSFYGGLPTPTLVLPISSKGFLVTHSIAVYALDQPLSTKAAEVAFGRVVNLITTTYGVERALIDSYCVNYWLSELETITRFTLASLVVYRDSANCSNIRLKTDYSQPSRRVDVLSNQGDELFDRARWLIYQDKVDGKLSEDRAIGHLKTVNAEYLNGKASIGVIQSKARNMVSWTRDNYTPSCRATINNRYYTKNKGEVMTRKEAAKKASDARAERSKVKIDMAINIITKESRKLTVRALAEVAEVSITTAQKYLKKIKDAEKV